MATVTLTYNSRNQLALRTLEYIMSLGVFKAAYKEPSAAEKKTLEAIEAARRGELTRCRSVEEYLKSVHS